MNLMSISDNLINKTLDLFRTALGGGFFERQKSFFENSAQWTAPLAAGLGLLVAVISAIKLDALSPLLTGIGWLALVCVGYYIGTRFVTSCEQVIESNPTSISSKSILDTTALIGILLLIGALVSSLITAIQTSSFEPIIIAVFVVWALLYLIAFTLNPDLVTTAIDDTATAGEDAIAISVLLSKCGVKIAPIIFGTSLIVGSLLLLQSIYEMVTDDNKFFQAIVSLESLSGVMMILSGLAYPLIAYLSFCFFYLFADLCKAILTLHKPRD